MVALPAYAEDVAAPTPITVTGIAARSKMAQAISRPAVLTASMPPAARCRPTTCTRHVKRWRAARARPTR